MRCVSKRWSRYRNDTSLVSNETSIDVRRDEKCGEGEEWTVAKEFVRVVGGKNDGREIKISVPRFVIGRGDTAHLRPSSDLVSREHCEILVGDGSVIVNELKSRNGTFVNGQLVASHWLGHGDTINIGKHTLVFSYEDGEERSTGRRRRLRPGAGFSPSDNA